MKLILIQKNRKPSIIETNLLYLATGLLLLTVGAKAQKREVYSGLLITEYIIILLPILLNLRVKGYPIKETLRLNRISFKQIIFIIFIVIFSYPIAVFLNYVGIMILSKYGTVIPNPVPIPSNTVEFLLGFIVIALTPGICEEVMFRGIVMNSYASLGRKKAIIYSAILFAIFHFNVQNLLGPIYLGILLGVLAYKTNSLFSAIVGHATNNSIALFIGLYSTRMEQNPVETTPVIIPEDNILIGGAIWMGIIAFISLLIVRKLIKYMPNCKEEKREEFVDFKLPGKIKMNIIELIPIAIIIVIYVFLNINTFFVLE